MTARVKSKHGANSWRDLEPQLVDLLGHISPHYGEANSTDWAKLFHFFMKSARMLRKDAPGCGILNESRA
jgi:hypothetical protein